MLTTYHILRPDAERETRETDRLPSRPTYNELFPILHPILGDFERVAVIEGSNTTDMFVDEMSLIKRLKRNEAATAIFRAAVMARKPVHDPELLPFIAGIAVLFDRPVWF